MKPASATKSGCAAARISPSCCSKAAPAPAATAAVSTPRLAALASPAACGRSAITTTGRAAAAAWRSCADEHAAPAGAHLADDLRALAARPEELHRRLRALTRDDHRHTDAAVEGAVHLGIVDARGTLQPAEQRILGPAAPLEHGLEARGQHPRDVVGETAAGGVRERTQPP